MLVTLILSNLINNEQYARKTLPHLLSEYFSVPSERLVFELIRTYVHRYNKIPNVQAVKLELFNQANINEHLKKECQDLLVNLSEIKADEDYLTDQTEKFCQDRSIELALYKSIDILQDKKSKLDRGAIPKILSDALAI